MRSIELTEDRSKRFYGALELIVDPYKEEGPDCSPMVLQAAKDVWDVLPPQYRQALCLSGGIAVNYWTSEHPYPPRPPYPSRMVDDVDFYIPEGAYKPIREILQESAIPIIRDWPDESCMAITVPTEISEKPSVRVDFTAYSRIDANFTVTHYPQNNRYKNVPTFWPPTAFHDGLRFNMHGMEGIQVMSPPALIVLKTGFPRQEQTYRFKDVRDILYLLGRYPDITMDELIPLRDCYPYANDTLNRLDQLFMRLDHAGIGTSTPKPDNSN